MKLHNIEVNQPRKLVHFVILAQLIVTILISLVCWVFWGWHSASSAFSAGVICAVVNCYFSWRVFRYWGPRQAKRFLMAFFLGELVKLIMLGLLFIAAVLLLRVAIRPFLVSFVVSLMIYWQAPFIMFGFINR